ncbi:hypothetical protein CU097_008919 [Rhizopus azygosporus]|uniref:CENP-T/Histone H4 histone fold domain-containing protein n=1 Tax=Rhizopus azygosporus TaxID=86630 RepID=A0A367J7E3_RHIAZ|nr:hypothetical protein CU097_008919 [Rhizopus azygosporus]
MNNRTYENHRQWLADRSPSEILRMLSRVPRDQYIPIPEEDIDDNENNNLIEHTFPPLSTKRSHELIERKDDFVERYRKRIAELNQNAPSLQQQEIGKPLGIDFRKKRNRHLDDAASVLSEMTIRTNTNYSAFDRLWQDDTMSVATQALLPREEEIMSPFFDKISHKSSPERFIQEFPALSPKLSQEEIEPEPYDQVEQEIQKEPMKEEEMNKAAETIETSAFQDDFMDDVDFGYAGIQDEIFETEGIKAMEAEPLDGLSVSTVRRRTTTRINPEHSFARRKIFDTASINIPAKDDAIRRQHVKKIFTNKIANNKRVPCNVSTFAMITDLFCDQLVDDLQAYKQNSPENPDEVTAEDMILLMRRQRMLSDKASLESLIYKHLPREYWDDLIVSALADNVLSTERFGLSTE